MITYIVLVDYTDKGAREIQDTTKRARKFKAAAKKAGVRVKATYWTMGSHDGVLVLDAPNDFKMAALLLELGKQGFVRTETLRTFDGSEIKNALS